MSNLKLANTHPRNLRKLTERGVGRVGHNTNVVRGPAGEYVIYYHGNVIAVIEDFAVYITNAGWDTPTTRNRLNIILRDNGIPFGLTQKNFRQLLVDGSFRTVIDGFTQAQFRMVAGVWTV